MISPRWLLLGLILPSFALGSDEPVRFRQDVAPILVQRCLGCHQDQDAQGGLNMTTFAKLKEGGDIEGDLILEPGDPDSSALIEYIRPDAINRMPFEQEPLTEAQIVILERWVAEGAEFDGGSEAETTLASLVDPLANLPEVAVRGPVADPVTALDISKDGARLAAGQGSTLRVFDLDSNQEIDTWADFPGQINALAFTPDSKTVVAAGGRPGLFGAVMVWDLETKERRHDLRGHTDAILGAALAPDGKTFATCSYDRNILIWNIDSGTEPQKLIEHTDAVYDLAFSPDGSTLASVSADRTAKVWDLESGRRRVSLSDATAELYAVAFAPDGKTVLAGGVDRSIWRWNVERDTGTLVRSVIAHDAPIVRLVVSDDGDRLYSSGEDRAVNVWGLPDLRPIAALPPQPEWPLALALNPAGTTLAVGRYDGSLALFETDDPADALVLIAAPTADEPEEPEAAEPTKLELVRNASLGAPNPKGATRGQTLRVDLSGNSVGQANAVLFDDPALNATILPQENPDPNRLQIELTVGPEARLGRHQLWVQTPLGVPGAQSFAVWSDPETVEIEPNNHRDEATAVDLPATLSGTINQPGDVDHFRFEVEAGQQIVFEDAARVLGSALDPLYELLDESGRVVARATGTLAYKADAEESFILRITDRQFGGSGNHFYRVQAGLAPYLADAFPIGVERGGSADIKVQGANLATETVTVEPTLDAEPGSIRPVPIAHTKGRVATGGPKLVVADGPQTAETEGNDTPSDANPIAAPGGVSGRIDQPGDVDHFRFAARKGQPLVVEVFAQRLGTKHDPAIEILDLEGNPIPLAVLRPLAETAVAFRDHNSTQDRIRLTKWDELAMDDYLLIGRELTRLFALPRNPDDDAVFWSVNGQRLAYFGTTPEQHYENQPMTKVEIHPPGTTFPPGGASPVVLFHRNDDGGPGLGKDSMLRFEPPEDSTYLVRVEDARGLGGSEFGYHLVIREPRPDFRVFVSPENPNIPRGGTTIVTLNVQRLDGFDAPIDVTVEDLPTGINATSARIEPGHYRANLLLTADASAPAFSPPTWKLLARAVEAEGSQTAAAEIRHVINPGGPRSGWITVTPEPDLKIAANPERVEIVPGGEAELTFAIERSEAFEGRVPIEVQNLPHGVRVLDIGLNGVLITEKESSRRVVLYAEPWVAAQERPFYAVGQVEAAGTSHSSPPITLVVVPQVPGPQAASARATGSE